MTATARPVPVPPAQLRALMQQHGLTNAAVARLTYVSPRQVTNWLTGRSQVPRWVPELIGYKILFAQVPPAQG